MQGNAFSLRYFKNNKRCKGTVILGMPWPYGVIFRSKNENPSPPKLILWGENNE